MTQMQVRLTSAEVLGAANIHFELLLGLILTLSREGFRTSLSRSVVSTSARNVALLPVPTGVAISVIVVTAYTTYLAPIDLSQHPQFTWATMTFLTGAVLELLAEPLYIDALVRLDTLTRVRAEGFAITAKSAAILASLAYIQDPSTLLPFGIGQMTFGGAFFAVFWISHAQRKGIKASLYYLWPSRSKGQPLFDRDALWLSFTMTRQNLIKHGLGEGDKLAVARLASLSDQGAYALASNYGERDAVKSREILLTLYTMLGSLVARILYQPLEESSRLTFARALGDSVSPSQASLDLSYSLLSTLLSFYVILSLFLVTFCPPYSTTLLVFLAGKRWAYQTSAPSILGVYGSTYLPVMAFNGLLEGFLQACASPPQLTRYAFVLMAASVVFGATLNAFHQVHVVAAEKGLIIASSLSTLARAAYCYHFTSSIYVQGKHTPAPRLSLSSLTVNPASLAVFALSAAVVYGQPYSTSKASDAQSGLSLRHLLAGLTCVAMCAGAW